MQEIVHTRPHSDMPTDTVESSHPAPRLNQSLEQFEVAFEQEMAAERRRRKQLRQRAANRSRARRIARTESHGKVRFSVLFIALTLTVVAVGGSMFPTFVPLVV